VGNNLKKVTNADSGTADIVGGDDWDSLIGIINDGWSDDSLKFKNPAGTFTLSARNPVATANKKTGFWQPFKYLIVRESLSAATPMYCINQVTREIEYEGLTSTPEDVFQYAFSNSLRAGIYVGPGPYSLSAGFAGLTMDQQETTCVFDPAAEIKVPQGYSGSLFILNANLGSNIRGGRFSEAGTPSKNWTCFYLHGTDNTNRVSSCSFRDMYIRFANNAFRLHTDTDGWINGCVFDKIYIDNSIVGFLFEHTGVFTYHGSGSNSNSFNDITIQAITGTTHGFKDINGIRNYFKNCYPADFTGSMVTSNISSNGYDTQIKGGTMTYLNFADSSSTGSWITDEFSGDVAPFRKTNKYHDFVETTAPSAPSVGVRAYAKTIDSNNIGYFAKRKINGSYVEVQVF
jgi:hypothetical protein